MGQYFAINLVNFLALKLWAYYRIVFCNNLKQSLKETHSFAPSFNLRRANLRRANLRRANLRHASGESTSLQNIAP